MRTRLFSNFLKMARLVTGIAALKLVFLFIILISHDAPASAAALKPEVEAFIGEMVEKHGFERSALVRIFSRVRSRAEVIEAISRPVTARPWNEYRPLFVNPERIEGGVRFWKKYAAALAKAERAYGISEEIIVSIIGIETLYGKKTGEYPVLDTLTTLAFEYPQRAEFFRSELEQYLLLVRERRVNALTMKGSYAGALGIPQFMPGIYRQFAVDFDGDGDSNLLGSAEDAIGSVANYLKGSGWQSGQPIMARAQVSGEAYRALLGQGIKPHLSVDEMRRLGVKPLEQIPGERQAALLELETSAGPEYWIVFNNFYVITRYNRSTNYAMTVVQLAEEIRKLRNPVNGKQ